VNVTADVDTVNLTAAREDLDLLATKIKSLEDANATIPTRVQGKSRTQQIAEITRQLLYLQHLCRRVENAIMDEYWHVRGQDDHLS
jgi:hypothetical protein